MRKRDTLLMVGKYDNSIGNVVVTRTVWPMRTVERIYKNPTYSSLARLDMLAYNPDIEIRPIVFRDSISLHYRKKIA